MRERGSLHRLGQTGLILIAPAQLWRRSAAADHSSEGCKEGKKETKRTVKKAQYFADVAVQIGDRGFDCGWFA